MIILVVRSSYHSQWVMSVCRTPDEHGPSRVAAAMPVDIVRGRVHEPALAIALAIGGVGLAATVIVVCLVGVVAYFGMFRPIRIAQREKLRVRELVYEDLRSDVHAAFEAALEKVADETLLVWIRVAYVDVLAEVRADEALRARLEVFYEGLPAGPVKDRLTDVVSDLRFEGRKKAGGLYRHQPRGWVGRG